MPRPQHEAGFTLVETLAGLAILSAVLMSTYSALSTSLALAHRVIARRDAVAAVEWHVSHLRSSEMAHEQVLSGQAGSYQWTISVEAFAPGRAGSMSLMRVTGRIRASAVRARAFETVLDTLVVGPRA